MAKMWYEEPTQVSFIDVDNEPYRLGGIAYRDELICGCCGAAISLEELYEEAREADIDEDKVIEVLDWFDISEAIKG